eukprot:CAMPEP_0194480856 /NCGR_PEP_ID=MMETSP0253-20130528/3517_1 /TAXON_ID=2966 /ORGANISM="Noctiluca scintillans" /LENGTH=266 /DNA_ID=CAMNT_0039320295 /DNA_START=175 /DNA_END=975 /DNA_ORIENTATION=+
MKRVRSQLRVLQKERCPRLHLKFSRDVLVVTGREQEVCEVRNLLRSVIGRRMSIPIPLWRELLRTRWHGLSMDRVTLARVQAVSGCNVHVDRDLPKVVLTGPDSCLAAAICVLHELAAECVKELYGRSSLDEVVLCDVADQCGVTFRVQDGDLAVFGLPASVKEAVCRLRQNEGSIITRDHDWQVSSGIHWMPPITPGDMKKPHASEDEKIATPLDSVDTPLEPEHPPLQSVATPAMSNLDIPTPPKALESWLHLHGFKAMGPFSL